MSCLNPFSPGNNRELSSRAVSALPTIRLSVSSSKMAKVLFYLEHFQQSFALSQVHHVYFLIQERFQCNLFPGHVKIENAVKHFMKPTYPNEFHPKLVSWESSYCLERWKWQGRKKHYRKCALTPRRLHIRPYFLSLPLPLKTGI